MNFELCDEWKQTTNIFANSICVQPNIFKIQPNPGSFEFGQHLTSDRAKSPEIQPNWTRSAPETHSKSGQIAGIPKI